MPLLLFLLQPRDHAPCSPVVMLFPMLQHGYFLGPSLSPVAVLSDESKRLSDVNHCIHGASIFGRSLSASYVVGMLDTLEVPDLASQKSNTGFHMKSAWFEMNLEMTSPHEVEEVCNPTPRHRCRVRRSSTFDLPIELLTYTPRPTIHCLFTCITSN